MTNAEIARTFSKIAEILAIQGENPFRIRAYERAAVTIAGLPQDIAEIIRRGDRDALREIPGIGEDLAGKIEELEHTGKLVFYEDLKRKVPPGLLEVMDVEGMGPKRTKFVWKEFEVQNISDLEQLCRSGKLAEVRGWGALSVENILQAINMRRRVGARMPLGVALPLAETLVVALKRTKLCKRIEIAGSIRRRKETIGDIDILATSEYPKRAVEAFCALPLIERVIAKGQTKANVLLVSGIEADLRVLDPDVFGAGLYYFTGSKLHNIHTRTMALKKGFTISEYGVFRGTKEHHGKRVACRTEEDVFRVLGLPFIPPEIREDTGEIEAALINNLPTLITEKDIHGDLHLHTDFSDGTTSIEEMIAAAKRAGHSYIAITDHASAMGMVHGIKRANVGEYIKCIRAAEKKVRGIHVLAGAEVDILEDGALYLPDATLKQLDLVVGAIHQNFRQSREVATKRLIRAMENPWLRVIGHPTTRLLGEREGMEFDWNALFAKAKEQGTVFELNASWPRLDLDDVRCRAARRAGVRVCINSDAHNAQPFDFQYGVSQARRGWLGKRDVVNAMPWSTFERWLQRK